MDEVLCPKCGAYWDCGCEEGKLERNRLSFEAVFTNTNGTAEELTLDILKEALRKLKNEVKPL